MTTAREQAGIEAVAEAWASIDGRLGEFIAGRGKEPLDQHGGYYAGYMEDAAELMRRTHHRGYVLVPLSTPPAAREPGERS